MASYGTTDAPANQQPLLEKYSSGRITSPAPAASSSSSGSSAAASSSSSAAAPSSSGAQSSSGLGAQSSGPSSWSADEQQRASAAAKSKAARSASSNSAALPTSGAGSFGVLVVVTQIIIFIIYAVAGRQKFKINDLTEEFESTQMYNYIVGVNLMLIVGFGYLRAFLKMYGLAAVGLTMFIYCLGLEVALILGPLFDNGWSSYIDFDLDAFLSADFAVAAFLVSFGALIGKVNPTQITLIVVLETIFYCLNKQVVLTDWIPFADVGNTVSVHLFGAYFGLAVSAVLGKKADMSKEASSTTSDVLALIGTVFMWVYWPAFNGANTDIGSAEAELAITNTITALVGSTVMTFALSALFNGGVISVVDIQSATLAGGVAIGATANLLMGPAVALGVGMGAGLVACIGTTYVQAALEKAGLHDTCGVHNLHGLPAIAGGLVSVFVPLAISDSNKGNPGYQLAGMGMTLVISVFGGAITGAFVNVFKDNAPMAVESAYFETADDKDLEAA